MLGPMLASGNLGPGVGPVIGGAVEMAGRPVWCFWVLVVFGDIALLLVGWTFPETRTVVGNGAVPAVGVWRTLWSLLVKWRTSNRRSDAEKNETEEPTKNDPVESLQGQNNKKTSEKPTTLTNTFPVVVSDNPNKNAAGRGKMIVPNPFMSLRLIFYWDTFVALWLAASPYTVWYLIQTSITIIYGQDSGRYGFKDIYVGLCYLTGGAGVIAGEFLAGRMMDINYRHVARRSGFSTDKDENNNKHDIHNFSIEEARSRFSLLILVVLAVFIVGYGWAVQYKVRPAVPLVL